MLSLQNALSENNRTQFFFSSLHGTFSRVDKKLGHKISSVKLRKWNK